MKRVLPLSLLIALLVLTTGIVWALPDSTSIDGDPADWSDATCLVDGGGVDDESAPTRADITEFCAHVDATYMYVAMAWDHSGFQNASTAGTRLDVDGDGIFDYSVLATLNGDPAVIEGFAVGTCDTVGSCGNFDDICSSTGGVPCTGALTAVSALWVDPFGPTGRTGNVCLGTDCTSYDAFVELALPWSLLGLSGPPNPHIFGDYGSYPSGPGQAPKDDVASGNGISCQPDGTCYVSGPTAITLGGMEVSAQTGLMVPVLAVLGVLMGMTMVVMRRRAGLRPARQFGQGRTEGLE